MNFKLNFKIMSEPNQKAQRKRKSFWDTTIGFFTKLSALITAIGAVVIGIQKLIPEKKVKENISVIDTLQKQKPEITNLNSVKIPEESNDSTQDAELLQEFLRNCVRLKYDEVISKCSVPFYLKSDVLISVPQLRDSLLRFISADNCFLTHYTSFNITRIDKLLKLGWKVDENNILSRLNIQTDDYIGVIYEGDVCYGAAFVKEGNTRLIASVTLDLEEPFTPGSY